MRITYERKKHWDRMVLRNSDRVYKVVAVVASLGLVAFAVTVLVWPRSAPKSGSFPSDSPPPTIAAGAPAPGFSIKRLGGGAEVDLGAYKGNPVILNFFASWCPDCQAELSAFATVAGGDAGRVDVVGVDTNDSDGKKAEQLLEKVGAHYPVGLDPEAEVASRYFIQVLPVTYFIDARGRVDGVSVGQLTTADLETWVKKLEAPGA
jgi:cytochrome c biogenesis protein CcmG/thiol:disulfide interchange protein DsbE